MGRTQQRADVPDKPNGPVDISGRASRDTSASEPSEFDTALDELSVSALINFFRVLDRWDRESKPRC